MASVDQAGGLGHHDPATGHYAELVIKGLADRDEATAWKNSLFRCAHYMSRNNIAPVSISVAKIEQDGTGFRLRFRAGDKTYARQRVLEKYGPDRSKWPYDPRRRGAA